MADRIHYIRTWRNYEQALRDLEEEKRNHDHDDHSSDVHLDADQDTDRPIPFTYNNYHVFPQEILEEIEKEKDDGRGGYRYDYATFHQQTYNELEEEEREE